MKRNLLQIVTVLMLALYFAPPMLPPIYADSEYPSGDAEEDDDKCKDKKAKVSDDCESCEKKEEPACPDNSYGRNRQCSIGAPVPTLDTDGKFYIRDTPLIYKSAIGPSFSMSMRYEPSTNRIPQNEPCGHNWSISYFDFDFELVSSTSAKFYFGNGSSNYYTKSGDIWEESSASGRASVGQSLWMSENGDSAVCSQKDFLFCFERYNGSDFRLKWISDRYGDKLKFYYNSGNDTKRFDYVTTADKRRFNISYWTGFVDDESIINGKLKKVAGPFRITETGYESVENATRSMEFSYVVKTGYFKSGGSKNYVLLETVTDMAGRFFTYEYFMTNMNPVTSGNYNYVISGVSERGGDTTIIKWKSYPKQITIYYPDKTWETVKCKSISALEMVACYWNSKAGSYDEPLKQTNYRSNYNSSVWTRDETNGEVDGLDRRTIRRRLSSTGTGGAPLYIYAARPFLADKTYCEIVTAGPVAEGNILSQTDYQYYQDDSQLNTPQDELTDLYQKYGYIYKETKYDKDGNILQTTKYENLNVDSNTGELISRDIVVTAGDGTLISKTVEIAGQTVQWSAEKKADIPAGYSLTYYRAENTYKKALNAELTQWSENQTLYNADGKAYANLIRTGTGPDDFAVTSYRTYYTEGDSSGRVKEEWTPAAKAIVLSGDALSTTVGLEKTSYTYDFAGDAVQVQHSIYDENNTENTWETVTNTYDVFHHKIESRYASNNSYELWSYACCGLASHTDRDGNSVIYGRDQRKRVIREIRMSAKGTKFMDTQYVLDVNSNRIKVIDIAGVVTKMEYDDGNRLIAATDELGRRTEFGYDLFDNLIYAINPDGTVIRNFYDNEQRVIHTAVYANVGDAKSDDLNVAFVDTTPLKSDDNQPLVNSKIYYPSGHVKATFGSYKHNASTLAINETDFSQKFEYDLGGRLLKAYTTTGLGVTYIRNEIDISGRPLKVYGPVLNGTSETAADLRQENIYGPNMALLYSVGAPYVPAKVTTTKVRDLIAFDYDYRFGARKEIKTARIDATASNVQSAIDNATFTTRQTSVYDERGRVSSSTSAGVTLTKTYAMENELRTEKTTYPDTSYIKKFYNGPFLTKSTDRAGVITEFEYDTAGNQTKVKINSQKIAQYTYDKFGRMLTQTDALNKTTSFSYNVNNNVTTITFADGTKQHNEYNLLEQLVKKTGANTYPVAFTYDANGKMLSLIDGSDSVTNWLYNQYGQLEKKLYNGSTETAPDLAYTYNLFGKALTRTDKRGVTTRIHYDNVGKVRGIDYPQFAPVTETVTSQTYTTLDNFLTNALLGDDIRISYDTYGRMSEIEGPTGTSTFTYDGISLRLAAEAGPLGTVSYTYSEGELDKLFTGTDIGTTDYLVDYTITSGRLTGISSTVNSKQAATSYAYQTGMPLVAARTTTVSTNSLTTDYTYNNAYQLTTIKHQASDASTISQYTYQLDDLGRRTSVAKTGTAYSTSQTINYGYNEHRELISATSTAVPDYNYSYDGIGNRTNYQKDQLKVQGIFSGLNQLTKQNYLGILPYTGTVTANSENLATVSVDGTAVSGVSGNPSVNLTGTVTTQNNKKIIVLAEDARGRKSSLLEDVPNEFTLTYDANGNLKTKDNRTYYWNCENRLVRLDITDGEKVTKIEFAYDFMGRRISKKVYVKQDEGSSFVLQSSYAFLYSGFKLIAKLDTLNSNALVQNFVWQPGTVGLDIPLSVYDVGDDANYFYLSDANKNIGQLVDSTGTIKAKYEYSPFGCITTQAGDYAEDNPFRFSSEYCDNESELVYYNYRYYDTTLGRWISKDPIGEQGGLNLYGIVQNDNINWTDSLGLEWNESWMDYDSFNKSPNSRLVKTKTEILKLFNGETKTVKRALVRTFSYKNGSRLSNCMVIVFVGHAYYITPKISYYRKKSRTPACTRVGFLSCFSGTYRTANLIKGFPQPKWKIGWESEKSKEEEKDMDPPPIWNDGYKSMEELAEKSLELAHKQASEMASKECKKCNCKEITLYVKCQPLKSDEDPDNYFLPKIYKKKLFPCNQVVKTYPCNNK